MGSPVRQANPSFLSQNSFDYDSGQSPPIEEEIQN
jgi:hypothetical protein